MPGTLAAYFILFYFYNKSIKWQYLHHFTNNITTQEMHIKKHA